MVIQIYLFGSSRTTKILQRTSDAIMFHDLYEVQAMPKNEEQAVLRRLDALEKTVAHGFAELQSVVSTLREQHEDLLTTEDVVAMTGRPYQTVIRDKSIPFSKRGKRRYYRKSDVVKHFLGEMHGVSVAELKEQAAAMIANRTR